MWPGAQARHMLRLIGVLLLIPLLDALLLVVLTGYLGWQLVVALVVLTALIGMLLVRAEGRHTMRTIQRKLAEGEPPTDQLIDGGLLLVSGVFLLTPGLVTDAIGFILVIPVTRYPVRWALKRWVLTPYVDAKTGGFASGNVYVGGFPGGDDDGSGPGPFAGRPGEGPSGEHVDLDEDAYDVEFDEENRTRRPGEE